MKKKLILLPLLAFTLSACGLTTNPGSENGNSTSETDGGVKPNDVAIRLLSATAFFPEVGDEVDFNEYVTFDPGFGHTLSEYTFKSSDNTVLKIEGYHATCLKSGFATVELSGPGINRKTEIRFWVGSIAGTYKPDNRRLSSLINFTIGEVNSERMSDFTLTINEGTFRNETVKAYNGSGQLFKNGTPFLTLNFEGTRPANFSPISSYLSVLGVELDGDYAAITDSVYGLMSYDVELGVSIRTIFMGEIVEFFAE